MFVAMRYRSAINNIRRNQQIIQSIRFLQTDCKRKLLLNGSLNIQKLNKSHNAIRNVTSIQQLFFIDKKYLTTTSTPTTKKDDDNNDNTDDKTKEQTINDALIYEGPFKELTLTLKRISVTTCAIGFVGIPMIVYAQNQISSTMSVTAQIVVASTTMLAACGSTIALSFCFSPYVHTLKYTKEEEEKINESEKKEKDEELLMEAVTCNILGMKVKTIFNPSIDITSPNKRPFCNFIAKGIPMYMHPTLIEDDVVRKQLFLDAADTLPKKDDSAAANDKKDDKNIKKDDDDFLL